MPDGVAGVAQEAAVVQHGPGDVVHGAHTAVHSDQVCHEVTV